LSAPSGNPVVYLIDVDNTLLDNDRFGAALGDHLDLTFGAAERGRYWTVFSERRARLGFADYLGSLEVFRDGLEDHPRLLHLAEFLLEYPFAELLYPDALATLAHLSTSGTPVLLSDGDIVFQPRKIRRAGLWDAVAGRVLVYLHKETMMDRVQHLFPAQHYLVVDDKPNLLAAMKAALGARITTVFVRQGHYAHDVQAQTQMSSPDRTIERIGDLMSLNPSDLQVRS
jgi:FMN phosphatase YigB (HAD superfamily)